MLLFTLMVQIELQKALMPSFTDDGLLEIIGQKDVWLAQKERICLDQVTLHLKFVFRLPFTFFLVSLLSVVCSIHTLICKRLLKSLPIGFSPIYSSGEYTFKKCHMSGYRNQKLQTCLIVKCKIAFLFARSTIHLRSPLLFRFLSSFCSIVNA